MKFIQANGSATEFVDSNVWLYALASGQDARKELTARKLLKAKRFAITLQVINEVSVNLMKKHGADEAAVQKLIRSFFRKQLVVETDKNVLLAASRLRTRYNFSFWDGLIVSAALTANANILYSEDMHDGLVVENKLKIVNPF